MTGQPLGVAELHGQLADAVAQAGDRCGARSAAHAGGAMTRNSSGPNRPMIASDGQLGGQQIADLAQDLVTGGDGRALR